MIYVLCCCLTEKCRKIQFEQGTNSGQFVSYIFSDFSLHKPVPATEVSGVSVLRPPVRVELHLLFRDTLGWGGHCQGGPRVPARDSMVPVCGGGFNHPLKPSDNNLSKYRPQIVKATNIKLDLSDLPN